MCENWACTFHAAGGGSQNHIMLGGFDAWLAQSVGGLDSVVNSSTGGWRHITARVSPAAIKMLGESHYSKLTRLGQAQFNWKWQSSGRLETEIEVPVGAVLTLETPRSLPGYDGGRAHALDHLSEGQSTLASVWRRDNHSEGIVAMPWPAGVRAVASVYDVGSGDVVRTTIGSGRYHFTATYR